MNATDDNKGGGGDQQRQGGGVFSLDIAFFDSATTNVVFLSPTNGNND